MTGFFLVFSSCRCPISAVTRHVVCFAFRLYGYAFRIGHVSAYACPVLTMTNKSARQPTPVVPAVNLGSHKTPCDPRIFVSDNHTTDREHDEGRKKWAVSQHGIYSHRCAILLEVVDVISDI